MGDEFGGGDLDMGDSDFSVTTDGNDTNIETDPDTIANLEDQGYGVEMEVTEPNADFSDPKTASSDSTEIDDIDEDSLSESGDDNSSNEQTDSGKDIPEDIGAENETNVENGGDNEIPEDTDSVKSSVRDDLKKAGEEGSDDLPEDTSPTEQGPKVIQKGK